MFQKQFRQSKASIRARRKLAVSRSDTLFSDWHNANVDANPSVQTPNLPAVTICVVTFNSDQWLDNFLTSIENLDYPHSKLSVQFMDHGSEDNSVIKLEQFAKKNADIFREINLSKLRNLGYGAGNDHGIRRATDDFILVVNVDTEFFPDSLKRIASVAVRDEKNVACWEFRQSPFEHPKYYDPITLFTNWTSHACVLMRRSAYLEIGGYDKRIFMYGEDVELSYRFRAHGWGLRYIPKAVIKHDVDLVDLSRRSRQLPGSVAANILLRFRYGTIRDILVGQCLLLFAGLKERDSSRRTMWKEARSIIKKNRRYFLKSRNRPANVDFPFNNFEYEIRRTGAAVKNSPFQSFEETRKAKVCVITHMLFDKINEHHDAIISVLNQTYGNIEYVIVVHGGKFSSSQEEKFAKIYNNKIRFVHTDAKVESYDVISDLQYIEGDFVCWINPNNLLLSDHIETLLKGFSQNDEALCSTALTWESRREEPGKLRNSSPSISANQLLNAQALFRFGDLKSVRSQQDLIEKCHGLNSRVSTPKITSIVKD